MKEDQRLGRDVFIALAAIGWADGKLDPNEADAIVRTALEEGLELADIAEIETATQSPIELSAIDRSNMSKADRLFVYAVAVWMTTLDGRVDKNEIAALSQLADALKLPDNPRRHAEALAQEIAMLPDGDAPSRYDLSTLRRMIGQRLGEAPA